MTFTARVSNFNHKPNDSMNDKEKSRTMQAFNRYRTRLSWASDRPEVWEAGQEWYPKAGDRLREATKGTTVSLHRAAGVAALLSPLTPWSRNLRGTEQLLRWYGDNAPHEILYEVASRSTVYNSNAGRAVKYLTGNDLLYPSGAKTAPFHANLSGDLYPVTIDSWMWRIVDGFGLKSKTPTGNAQRAIERAVRMCATLCDIHPAQAQAIIWIVERDYWNGDGATRTHAFDT